MKMTILVVAMLAWLMLMASNGSEAVECYQCSDAAGVVCGDPFQKEGVPTCNGSYCLKDSQTQGG